MKEQRGVPVSMILIAGTVLLFAPLVALGAWEAVTLAERERASLEDRAGKTAFQLRSEIDRALTHYIAILETLAAAPAVDQKDLAEIYTQAEAALKPHGLYALMRDLTGQQLLNTRVPFGTPLPREKGFDDPVFETRKPYVSDVVIGAVAKKPVVGVSVPVLREGELRSILTLSLDTLIFANMLARVDLPEDWTIDLVDQQGVRIARSDRHAELVGLPLPEGWRPEDPQVLQRSVDIHGRPVIRSVRQSLLSGWSVVVTAPEMALTNQVRASVLGFVGASVAIALLALLGASLLGRHIVSSLGAVARAARDLGEHRPISFQPSILRETNLVGEALVSAAAQRDLHEQQIQLLMREVHHRSKNLLAVVQSIAQMTKGSDVEVFRERFCSRLRGLAANQDVLVTNRWQGADVRALVTSHISVFGDPASARFVLSGPSLQVSPSAAQALGMALHELGTNAVKYGALASGEGSILIDWAVEGSGDDRRFRMTWRERGGPAVAPPEDTGFGHTVMVRMVESSLRGSVAMDFLPDGLVWALDAPLASLTAQEDDDAPGPGRRTDGVPTAA